jgi:hypothetical protein
MKITVSGIYTNPSYFFDLSDNFLNLFKETVCGLMLKNEVNIPAEVLEIILRTDGTSEQSRCEKISKRKGKFLRFDFWISYPKTVIALHEGLVTDINLSFFTREMMLCLRGALLPYGANEDFFAEAEKAILSKIAENPEFYALQNIEVLTENRKFAVETLAKAEEMLALKKM